jgi:biotin transport system substrate-specific component
MNTSINKTQRGGSSSVSITVSALFVALMAVCSWISVPVPGTSVPINLATFAVLLAGVTLGRKYGTLSVLVFLLLGAVGVPVFHSFTGGMGIVLGPTGGFLIGYLALAFFGGLYHDLAGTTEKSASPRFVSFILFALAGEVLLYALGVIWFMFSAGAALSAALLACVVPFIPGDIVKVILVYLVSRRLEKVIQL